MYEKSEKRIMFDFPSSVKKRGKGSWLLEKHCRSGREGSAPILCKPETLSFTREKHFPNSQRNAETQHSWTQQTSLSIQGYLRANPSFERDAGHGNCSWGIWLVSPEQGTVVWLQWKELIDTEIVLLSRFARIYLLLNLISRRLSLYSMFLPSCCVLPAE